MQQNTCDEALAVALYSERVQTLLRAIKVMGCGALRKGISCRVCDKPDDPYYQGKANTQGYFDSKHRRVVLCCEQIATQKDLEDTLVHELVHAFDSCRSPGFQKVAELQACSEIRASHLGQCQDKLYASQRTECIKNDATLSLMSSGGHSHTDARVIVEKAFLRCYNDRSPFVSRPMWERDTKK